jgi:hypothetical protein
MLHLSNSLGHRQLKITTWQRFLKTQKNMALISWNFVMDLVSFMLTTSNWWNGRQQFVFLLSISNNRLWIWSVALNLNFPSPQSLHHVNTEHGVLQYIYIYIRQLHVICPSKYFLSSSTLIAEATSTSCFKLSTKLFVSLSQQHFPYSPTYPVSSTLAKQSF